MEYTGEERHNIPMLTAEQIDLIAERAAEKAIEKVYIEIGRNVVRKALWIIGAGVVALLVWLAGSGKLP